MELPGLWLAHQRHGKLPWDRLLQVLAARAAPAGWRMGPRQLPQCRVRLSAHVPPCLPAPLTHLQPAIDIAEAGFTVHAYLATQLENPNTTDALLARPATREAFLVKEGGKVRVPGRRAGAGGGKHAEASPTAAGLDPFCSPPARCRVAVAGPAHGRAVLQAAEACPAAARR